MKLLHGGSWDSDMREPHTAAAAAPRSKRNPRGGAKRVLIIDDSIAFATLLARLLKRAGYQVCTWNEGRSAVQLATEWRPDLILLDLLLPDLTGLEVCRRLRQQDALTDTTIVCITGYEDTRLHKRAATECFDSVLVKPMDLAMLPHMLETILQGKA